MTTITGSAETVTGTTHELAASLGVDYAHAAGFLKFLRAKGVAKDVGNRKSGKGKPSMLFSMPKDINLSIVLAQVDSAPTEGGATDAPNGFTSE